MNINMMSHVKVHSLTFCYILLVEFGEFPIELYAFKLTTGFQRRHAHLPSSWLVSQATSLSRHLVKQGYNTRRRLTTVWKASWGLSHWETHDNSTTSNIALNDIKEAFLTKEWNYYNLLRKKPHHLKGFSQIQM